jgi:hypothetical protein
MALGQSNVAATTSVAVSTTSAPLFALGAGTRFRGISNITGQIIYVLFGNGTASATNHTVPIAAGGYYEFPQPLYTGPVSAVTATGSGNALITTY